jgi:DNA-binding CsgD family transcriptional regulator
MDGGKRRTTPRENRGRQIQDLREIAAVAAGFCLTYLAEHLASAQSYTMIDAAPWASVSLFGVSAMLVIGIAAIAAGSAWRPKQFFDWVAAALCCACAAWMWLCEETSLAVWVTMLGVVSVCDCWLAVRCLARIASDKALTAAVGLAVGIVAVSAAKIVLSLVPVASPVVAIVAPLACALVLKRAPQSSTHVGSSVFTGDAIASLWPTALAVAVFVLLWSMLNMALKVQSGHYGVGDLASPGLVAIAQLIDAAFSLVLLWWLLCHCSGIAFNGLWRIALVCLAMTMVAVAFLGAIQAAQIFTSAAYEIADMVIWLALASVARQSDANPYAVCSLGLLAVLRIPDSTGRVLVAVVGLDVLGERGLVISMLTIIATVAFLLPHRSPAIMLLFSDLGGSAPEATDSASVHERCASLAREHGLSARERQIIEYLCYGRSKQYIAETLYLSENTIKTYTKRIYAKLGIHSREELQNLVGMG